MAFTKRFKVLLGAFSVVVVAAVVAIAVVIVLQDQNGIVLDIAKEAPITFDEFLRSSFSAENYNGSWWSSKEILWQASNGDLVLWNVDSKNTTVMVSTDSMSQVSKTAIFVAFAPVPPEDRKLLMFKDNVKPVWRHSSLAAYTILDDKTNNTFHIHPKSNGDQKDVLLQYAQWSPGSSNIIYVYNNNIYLRRDYRDTEGTNDLKISQSGIEDQIYNGIPDWVYEEEVLSSNKALYFTKSGDKMAFLEFNDTLVEEFIYPKYGKGSAAAVQQYPEYVRIKYPKTGTVNPTVAIKVVDNLKDAMAISLSHVSFPQNEDIFTTGIISGMKWIDEDKLSVVFKNRIQTKSFVAECIQGKDDWTCSSVNDRVSGEGWLDSDLPEYNAAGTAFFQIRAKPGKLHFPHVAYLVPNDDDKTRFISDGNFAVTSILGYDDSKDEIFFMGTGEMEPGQRHLYRGRMVSSETTANVECVTCSFNCLLNSVALSPDFEYFVHSCLGPTVPTTVLRKVDDPATVVEVLVDNLELRLKLTNISLPQTKHLYVEVEEGLHAPVKMVLPENYDESVLEKYSLLVYVYGGPGSQLVDHKWSIGWEHYLTSNYDIVYAIIDGRGTGFQSMEYMYRVYENLGSVEMEDQIMVAQKLLDMFPYLNPSRTGIWGWSYGGYATIKTLMADKEDVFKCGVAVAPPTDWKLYDTVYTERYMNVPEDNAEGYNRSTLLNKVEDLRGKTFMINHGVADDNVHYQNTMLLIKELELADIQFQLNSYPDENHSLGSVKRYLYHKFDKFWAQCLGFRSEIPSK